MAAAVPMAVESIVGEGRRQRRKSERYANKTAERNGFGLDHGVPLPDGADKLRPIRTTLALSVTQRSRSVLSGRAS
jgi:hypothetical protein